MHLSVPPDYTLRRIPLNSFRSPDASQWWHGAVWQSTAALRIDQFHPSSTDHHPRVEGRFCHDTQNIFGRFVVDDRYVLSRATEFQQLVSLDSCVEFFFQPPAVVGYFNLEINCGGTALMWYVEDWRRTQTALAKIRPFTDEAGKQIHIYHSMPATVFPEIKIPVRWSIGFQFPLALLSPYIGGISDLSGQTWRANFYKCADESSHPHWASWSPIGEELNFHDPERFGTVRFAV
jgi:hypothetical protein